MSELRKISPELKAILAAHAKWRETEGAEGARADLRDADLRDAKNVPANIDATAKPRHEENDVPLVERINTQILGVVDGDAATGKLEMSHVHICATTHCMAGWAVHLAGEAGYALERKIGWDHAARLIFRKAGSRVPHFHANNERALADLHKRAEKEAAPAAEVAP